MKWSNADTLELKEYVSKVSLPRSIGTSGNTESKKRIIKHCKKFVDKRNILIDSFKYTDKAEKISLVFFSTFIFIFSFLAILGLYLWGQLLIIGSASMLAFILLFFNYWIEIFDLIGKFGKIKCNSIIVKMGEPSSKNKLMISAHRDSLSSNPAGVRYFDWFKILFFKAPVTICIIALIYAFLQTSVPTVNFLLAVLFSASSLSLIFFAAITSFGNESPGAYDNGTGVAVLMKIVEQYSRKKIPLQLWVAFLDCEEAGYAGASSLAKKLDKDIHVLNLDGIGSGELELAVADGPFRSPTNKAMNKKISAICKKLKLEIVPTWSYLYPGSDHVPFVKKGFNATMITSSSFNIHSKEDTIDKVEFGQMHDVLNVIDLLIKDYALR